jgi:membrane-bound serine protease (ClpP class)
MRVVIILVALVLAVLVLPRHWAVPVVLVAAVAEIGELAFWVHWNRRRTPVTGAESLVGAVAEVVAPCEPDGTVRIVGELWQAHCEEWAQAGAAVVVREMQGLVLVVDPDR